MRLAVAIGQRDVDSLDYYYGPPDLVADISADPSSLKKIHNSILALIGNIKRDPYRFSENQTRDAYLLRQLKALDNRVDMLMGKSSSFDEESNAIFGTFVPAHYAQKDLRKEKAELQRLLPGNGALAERYDAFDRKFSIAPDRVPAVMERAISACRTETMAHISLPPGEKITVEYVSKRGWSAYSWYKGNYESVVQINMDFPMTVDRALQLACHEAYPGHHVYNTLREAKMVRGRGYEEYEVQPTFSPQSFISESMATIATDISFTAEKRLRLERDVLFPLAGMNGKTAELYLRVEGLVDELHPVEPIVARQYLDGKLEFERACEQLTDAALMAHPESTLKYINEYRSYVITYTYGRDIALQWITEHSQRDEESRWNAYLELMMQDASVLSVHDDAAKNINSFIQKSPMS